MQEVLSYLRIFHENLCDVMMLMEILHLEGRTMMRMSKKMVVLGQTVRLLPIIGEADKAATHLSTCSTRTHAFDKRERRDRQEKYLH